LFHPITRKTGGLVIGRLRSRTVGVRSTDARFSRYGFSSRDASDSYAGYLIVMWEVINNQSASAHPAGIRQIRQKVNELLLSKFGSKTIADGTKQYYSEYYKLLAVCYLDALKHPESVDVSVGGAKGYEALRMDTRGRSESI
jgi:hypothetical protein